MTDRRFPLQAQAQIQAQAPLKISDYPSRALRFLLSVI
jgi:hypothetical protein